MRGNFNNYLFNDNKASRGRLSDVVGNYTTGNANANYLETGITGSINKDFQPLSDYYLENASFVKMDNLNIGYNVGRVFNQKASLRLNAFVQNVFTITKYSGLDPESNTGMDNSLYPRPRIFSLGANLDF
jgi:iron complex outermembrane receptor protein